MNTQEKEQFSSINTFNRKLSDNLRDALALSQKLEYVLATAQKKMKNQDHKHLKPLLDTQVKLLNMLQLNSSLRARYLKKLSVVSSDQSVEAYLSQLPVGESSNPIRRQWWKLENCASRCQILNQTNSQWLMKLADSTESILNATCPGRLTVV